MYLLFFRSSWSEKKLAKRSFLGILYLIPPIGTILVALFPENFIPIVHLIDAFLTFTFGGISAVYSYKFVGRPLGYICVLLGLITLASIPLLGGGASLGFGLVERLTVYPFIMWSIIFGAHNAAEPLTQ